MAEKWKCSLLQIWDGSLIGLHDPYQVFKLHSHMLSYYSDDSIEMCRLVVTFLFNITKEKTPFHLSKCNFID